MRRTPQYKLTFYQDGDIYRASEDLDRMTVTDNQLWSMSQIAGDGRLTGWDVTCPLNPDGTQDCNSLAVWIAPGSGFINKVAHRTRSFKIIDSLINNATNRIYLQSTLLNPATSLTDVLGIPYTVTGGFTIEAEGPLSDVVSTLFTDSTAPDPVTGLVVLTTAGTNVVTFAWDASAEIDFSHYELYRQTGPGPFVFSGSVLIDSRTINPVIPATSEDDLLQDSTTAFSTEYTYGVYSVDISGNKSVVAEDTVTTPADIRLPGDVKNLRLFPGKDTIAVVFEPSQSSNIISYRIAYQRVLTDGSLGAETVLTENLSETRLIEGLVTDARYRITVKARSSAIGVDASGNLSPGIVQDAITLNSIIMYPPLSANGTSVPNGVTLGWSINPSNVIPTPPTLPVIGEVKSYRIRVIVDGVESAYIDVGTALTKTLLSYNLAPEIDGTLVDQAIFGVGSFRKFTADVDYLFKITAVDPLGNESGATIVKSQIQDTDIPKKAKDLIATAGDEEILVQWTSSSSRDVVGYNLSYNNGSGYISDIVLGKVTQYTLTGLTNDLPTTVRLRARDDAGLLSNDSLVVVTPVEDTIAPGVPDFFQVNPGDESSRTSWATSVAVDLVKYILRRRRVANRVDTNPNIELTVLDTRLFDIDKESTSYIDANLVNGLVYAYDVAAVDARGNQSEWSPVFLISPGEGLNSGPSRIEAPYSVQATTGTDITGSYVELTWLFDLPMVDGFTAFNIYRADEAVIDQDTMQPIDGSNFKLIASQDGDDAYSFKDYDAISGVRYFYRITALRDDADGISDTGTISPPNSILLAVVKTEGGQVVSIEQSARIIENLDSTLAEETMSRLLAHRHTVSPENIVSVACSRILSLVDITTLPSLTLPETLSPAAVAYYEGLVEEAGDFDALTTFVLSPTNIIWNVPSVGDFQAQVNSLTPTMSFRFDEDRNAIVFSEALKSTDVATVNGLGTSYYIPSRISLDFRGYSVLIDGVKTTLDFGIDEELQTIRFLTEVFDPASVTEEPVVSVGIEPAVPEYGNQEGSRQVSLSPDTVLTDFSTVNQTTFISESGEFEEGDVVFVFVDGERTELDHFVDFANKSIVFSSPLPVDSTVALEIRGQPEVQGELSPLQFGDLDASQFTTGKFTKPQLPPISHEGRVKEAAFPLFESAVSDDRYVYLPTSEFAGSGTTPYASTKLLDGNVIVGSSNGMLRTSNAGIFLKNGDTIVSEVLSGLNFAEADDIVQAARLAEKFSGRIQDRLTIPQYKASISAEPISFTIESPCVIELDDGKVLICGGVIDGGISSLSAVYDPNTGEAIRVGDMILGRKLHAMVRLTDGRVLCSGGLEQIADPGTADYFEAVVDAELFDPTTETWAATTSMDTARANHTATLVVSNDAPLSPLVLVSGGEVWTKTFVPNVTPYYKYAVSKLNSAERYFESSSLWDTTTAMPEFVSRAQQKSEDEFVFIDTEELRLTYDASTAEWERGDPVLKPVSKVVLAEIDGPAKQFFRDSEGVLWTVTRNNVYLTNDEGSGWVATKGLDFVGVVHHISEDADGQMYAATDLGVYEMTTSNRLILTWFQGPLISAGTTETFDLQPIQSTMLAATEIGIFIYVKDADPDLNEWVAVLDQDDVFNLEAIGAQTVIAQIGKDIWRSDTFGQSGTWARYAYVPEADKNSKLLGRDPSDIFLGTTQGLFYSVDAVSFSRVHFDRNRNTRLNNVSSLDLVGDDVVVGFDNAMFTVDSDNNVIFLGEFNGSIPTVRINDEEIRGGFRYDVSQGLVILENKSFADDIVTVSSNYSVYELIGGSWYHQNPTAPIRVFVNGKAMTDEEFSYDARKGRIAFFTPLVKFDIVTVSLAGTSLKNEGQLFHEELEDRLELEKGLPLSLGQNHAANILQMGLSIEHNFWEQGLERDQYYCLTNGSVDRPFTSFMDNSQFYILGRRDYDALNSTIDYDLESEQVGISEDALATYAVYEEEVSGNVWIGTDKGIFAVSSPDYEVVDQIAVTGRQIKDIKNIFGTIYSIAHDEILGDGLYSIDPVSTDSERNLGNNLPDVINTVCQAGNTLVVGTSEGVFYSTEDEPNEWFAAAYVDADGVSISVSADCPVMNYAEGLAFAAIGQSIFTSADGKVWRQIYEFKESDFGTLVITKMEFFARALFVATNKGVFWDEYTARSTEANFSRQQLEADDEENEAIYVNDLFSTENILETGKCLYAAGDTKYLYKLTTQDTWTREDTGLQAVQKVMIRSDGTRLLFLGNGVYTG